MSRYVDIHLAIFSLLLRFEDQKKKKKKKICSDEPEAVQHTNCQRSEMLKFAGADTCS